MTWDTLRRELGDPATRRLAASLAAPVGLSDEEQLMALVDALEERARNAGEDWLVTIVARAGSLEPTEQLARADHRDASATSAAGGTAWLLAGSAGPGVSGRLAPGSLRGALTPALLAAWHTSHLDGAQRDGSRAPRTWPSWVAAPPEFRRELIVHGDAAEPLAAEPLAAEPLAAGPLAAGPLAAGTLPSGTAPPGWTLVSGEFRRAQRSDGRWFFCAGDRSTLVLRQRVPLPASTARRARRVLRVEAEFGAGDAVVEFSFGHTAVSLGPGATRRTVTLEAEIRDVEVTVTVAPGAPARLADTGAGLARVSLEVTAE